MRVVLGPPASGKTARAVSLVREGPAGACLAVLPSFGARCQFLIRLVGEGGGVLRPPVFSIDGLARRVLEGSGLTRIGKGQVRLILASLMRRLEREGRITRLAPSRAGAGAVAATAAALAELKWGAVEPAHFAAAAARRLRDRPLYAELATVYAEYSRLLEERSLVDPEGWTWLLAASLSRGPTGPLADACRVVFDGFRLLTPSQAALLASLERTGLEVHLFLPETAGRAPALPGLSMEDLSLERLEPRGSPNLLTYTAATVWEEARAAAAWARRLLSEGVGTGRIAFIVRKREEYAVPLASACEEYGVPLLAPEDVPPVLLAPLRAVASGWGREAVLACAYAALDPTDAAVLRDAAERRGVLGGRVEWESAVRMHPGAAEPWGRLLRVLEPLSPDGPAPLARWVEALRGALRGFAGPGRAALAEAEAALDLLEEALGVPGAAEVYAEEFLAVAKETLAERTPAGMGVRVLSPEDAAPLRLAGAWVLGVTEGTYPWGRSEGPLFSGRDRELLREEGVRLRLPAEEREEEEILFRLTATRGEASVLSVPSIGQDGRPAAPSHLLETLGAAELHAPVPPSWLTYAAEEAGWAAGQQEPPSVETPRILRRSSHGAWVERQRERAPGETPWDGRLTASWVRPFLESAFFTREFSVHELCDYAICPMRFFLQRALGLEETEEPALGLSRKEAGILLHEVLAEVFRSVRGIYGEIDAGALVAEALALLAKRGEEWASGRVHPDAVRTDVRSFAGLLERALAAELASLSAAHPQARVLAGEVAFGHGRGGGREAGPLLVDGVGIAGRMDRVDEAPEGLLVTDYKLSTAPRRGEIQDGRDPQALLYVLALERVLWPGKRVKRVRYRVLRRNEAVEADVGAADRERWAGQVASWLRGIRGGEFGSRPEGRDRCRRCPARGLCRTKWDLLEVLEE